MTFQDRLARLGCDSYEEYLCSEHWKAFRAAYSKSDRPQLCEVCRSFRIQLHHITYDRLGEELLTDVVPLCRFHHKAVHDWLKKNGSSPVTSTFKAVRFLEGLPLPTRRQIAKRLLIERAKRKHKTPEPAIRLQSRPKVPAVEFQKALDYALSHPLTERQKKSISSAKTTQQIYSQLRQFRCH